jgi:hypothetical protein
MKITVNDLQKINMEPQTVTEEIMQNVAVVLATPKYSVPLDRGLGLNMTFLDKPVPAAKVLAIGDIMDAIEEAEPRVRVTDVDFLEDGMIGRLVPVVEVELIDGGQ